MHPELRRERPANGGSGPSAFHRTCIADLCCVLYEGPLWAQSRPLAQMHLRTSV